MLFLCFYEIVGNPLSTCSNLENDKSIGPSAESLTRSTFVDSVSTTMLGIVFQHYMALMAIVLNFIRRCIHWSNYLLHDAGEFRSRSVCPGQSITLSCPRNERLAVQSAAYVTFTGGPCSSLSSPADTPDTASAAAGIQSSSMLHHGLYRGLYWQFEVYVVESHIKTKSGNNAKLTTTELST